MRFIDLAKETLGPDFKQHLLEQHSALGTKEMAAKWGYHPRTILHSLHSHDILPSRKDTYRKVEEMLEEGTPTLLIAAVTGKSRRTVTNIANRLGFRYTQGEWRKDETMSTMRES